MGQETTGNAGLQELLVAAMTGPETQQYREEWGDPVDRFEYLNDTPGFTGVAGRYARESNVQDRSDGKYLPVYEHETDLRIIRALSWLLKEKVPPAKTIVERLKDYTIGTGFDWKFTSRTDREAAERLNRMVMRVLEENKYHDVLERELYARKVEDGEYGLEIVKHGSSIELLTREMDELTEPANTRPLEDWLDCSHFVSSWSFGVHTEKNKPHKPLGYHCVRDLAGMDWDYIPESRFLHAKRNVRRNAKRGVSDFYVPHMLLRRADKVLTNTAEGAAIVAAIAYITEHAPGVTAGQIQNRLLNGQTGTGGAKPVTGQRDVLKDIRPGTIRHVPNATKVYQGLLGSNSSNIYIDVMSAALRVAGAIYAMPEGMITGDYSNANLASALVAESPFAQGRLADQKVCAAELKELLWKIVRMLDSMGMLSKSKLPDYEKLRVHFDLTVNEPKIIQRDRESQVRAISTELALGLIGKRTAATELGRDFDAEQDQIQSDSGQLRAQSPPATDGSQPPQNDQLRAQSAPTNGGGEPPAPLNGAQIQSAQTVLQSVSVGQTPKEVAVGLLTSLGLDSQLVATMVQAALANASNMQPPAPPVDPQPKKEELDIVNLSKRIKESWKGYP